jgi:hypothetical protein
MASACSLNPSSEALGTFFFFDLAGAVAEGARGEGFFFELTDQF